METQEVRNKEVVGHYMYYMIRLMGSVRVDCAPGGGAGGGKG